MTESQSLVERLAGEAGFELWAAKDAILAEGVNVTENLAKFAELVAAECAGIVDGQEHDWDNSRALNTAAAAIRQRFGVVE